MNIPTELLQHFKCSKCEYYLRRAPVYLQPDGLALCATCYKSPCVATRDKYYEAAARLLFFPCRNADIGCKETVPFLEEGCMLAAHEEVCSYRQYVCPLLGSSRCDWLGTRDQIADHCQREHSHLVQTSPATFTYDISTSSQSTFLLSAFNALFLLYVKICTKSASIYHSVRYLGCSEEVSQFKYILVIKRQNEKIEKEGTVAPQGCLAIQKPTSLALDINSLLNVLGGGDGSTFTIILQRAAKESFKMCSKCKKKVTELCYFGYDGWCCDKCAPVKTTCRNSNCNYVDYLEKCYKHEQYFCTQRTKCVICSRDLNGKMIAHYRLAHKDVIHRVGSKCQLTPTDMFGSWFLLSYNFNLALCQYRLDDSGFRFWMYLSVPLIKLQQFECEVRLTERYSGKIHIYTPDVRYHVVSDWGIVDNNIKNCEIDITINILET